MIYTHGAEIVILFIGDGRATAYVPEKESAIDTTSRSVEHWLQWLPIIVEADSTPAIKALIRQAEFIYGLCQN